MLSILCVGAGGFIGAIARYLMGFIPFEGDFPLPTFLINFLGAVAIGAVVEIAGSAPGMSNNMFLFLRTGVCGGFTTFSTFSLETLVLLQKGEYLLGGMYAAGSVVACVLGTMLGMFLARTGRSLLGAEGMPGA